MHLPTSLVRGPNGAEAPVYLHCTRCAPGPGPHPTPHSFLEDRLLPAATAVERIFLCRLCQLPRRYGLLQALN
jgi:hypothetical protein